MSDTKKEYLEIVTSSALKSEKSIIKSIYEGVLEKLTNDDKEDFISERKFTIELLTDQDHKIISKKLINGEFTDEELELIIEQI